MTGWPADLPAEPLVDLPLRSGARGPAVHDIRRRLAALGYATTDDEPARYGVATSAAVRRFQEDRGLRVDGICGRQTWASLVEAGYRLGDRFLYLRTPMLRGDDVAELQRRLGGLGFDAGRVDGILGPRTTAALTEFQRNAGLTTDGICGPDTLDTLDRWSARTDDTTTVAAVREEERLRDSPRQLTGRRLAVGETGGLAGLADAVGRALGEHGAVVAVLNHPDESIQAAEANAFEAEAFVGLALLDNPGCRVAFYGADGFTSLGGKRLAELILAELASTSLCVNGEAREMRLPLLRETRMPAVVCEIGPPAVAVTRAPLLVNAITRAVAAWSEEPLDSPEARSPQL